MCLGTGLFILRVSVSIMIRTLVTFLIFSVIGTLICGQQLGEESCETLPFQLHLIKGFTLELMKNEY